MAEKRMFTKKITDSDAFCELPLSTQALYFQLCMNADDDGFLNNSKKIQRAIGASDDDMSRLVAKRYLLTFDNGVVVIKHWRMHNTLRKDRYTETQYLAEKESLDLQKDGSYTEKRCGNQMATKWQPIGNHLATQYSVVKSSIEESSIDKCSSSVVDGTATATENDEVVENSVENFEPLDYDVLKCRGGTLFRNVVYLTDRQNENLLDLLDFDAYNRYCGRLADFIIDKNAHVNNHYETILKWYKEDTGA